MLQSSSATAIEDAQTMVQDVEYHEDDVLEDVMTLRYKTS